MRLPWLDIETTGLNSFSDQILEIGISITDEGLNILSQKNWVLPHNGFVSDFIKDMHTKSGLLAECKEKHDSEIQSYGTYCAEISEFLQEHLEDASKPPLCGSSVGFDKDFIKNSIFRPILNFFSYRIIDVSSIKELCKMWAPEVYETRPQGEAKHRALPDIEFSIQELKHYKKHLWENR